MAICPILSLRFPDEKPLSAADRSGFFERIEFIDELVLELSNAKGLTALATFGGGGVDHRGGVLNAALLGNDV